MQLNRRAVLQAGIAGAVSLGLSGCGVSGTTLVFANNAHQSLDFKGTLSQFGFSKFNVQPGHSATQLCVTKDPYKSAVPASVVATWYKHTRYKNRFGGITYENFKVDDALVLDCIIGMINTFTFTIVQPTLSELDDYLTFTSSVS